MVAFTVRMDGDLHERLRRASFNRREPMGRIIEYALMAWFDAQLDEWREINRLDGDDQ